MAELSSIEAWRRLQPCLTEKQNTIFDWMLLNYLRHADCPPPWSHAEMRMLVHRSGNHIPEIWKRLREMWRLGMLDRFPRHHTNRLGAGRGRPTAWALKPKPPKLDEVRQRKKDEKNGTNTKRLLALNERAVRRLRALRGRMLKNHAPGDQVAEVSAIANELEKFADGKKET